MFSESLKKDVRNQAGSIYSLNAPHAIGYLFTVAHDGKEVYIGMFAHRWDEVDKERWDGFFSTKGEFFDLKNNNDWKRLMQ